MMKRVLWMLIMGMLMLMLGACGGADSVEEATRVAMRYFTSLASKDLRQFQSSFCAGMEAEAMLLFDSLGAVEPQLANLSCSVRGLSGDEAVVTCLGELSVSYDGEDRVLMNLSDESYSVVREDGIWRMCGTVPIRR